MTEQTGRKLPQIRFKGFKDEWEQNALGDVGQTQSGIGFSDAEQGGTAGTPFFKVSDMSRVGNYQEMLTSNNYVSDAQLIRKKWTPISDVPAVIFAKVGAAIMLNRKRMVRRPFLIDNNLMAYHFDDTWDKNFGRTLFDTINLPLYAQVGALPSYNGSDIESIVVHRPRNLDEQTKIGEYFRELDSLIGLYQRKHDKLVTLKKAMLQKMFPQPGATSPEIRFKGFEGDWVERKLGELCQEFHSGKFISASDIAGTGQYPVYGGNGLRGFSAKYNHDGLYALIGRQGALCGNMNFVSGRVFLTEHAIAVQGDKENDTLFLFYLLGQMNLGQYSSQSAQPGLAVNKLQKLSSFICKKSEQIQIGVYFRALDELISKHATQLQKLQQLKFACLEKIFV